MNIVVADARAIVSELEAQRRPNTRVLYIESPGSLLFEMLDIPALADYTRKHKLILIADNTWGSGYIYRPLDLRADISVVAGTKYRSEERRGGKESVSRCKSGWAPTLEKKK